MRASLRALSMMILLAAAGGTASAAAPGRGAARGVSCVQDRACRQREAARYVAGLRRDFTINGHPVHPFVFRDLAGWISDGLPIITGIDLLAGAGSNYYFSGSIKKTSDGYKATDKSGTYAYSYIGPLRNGLMVVKSWSSGGGSGIFYDLFFLDAVPTVALDFSGKPYLRLNLEPLREVTLGDRWGGTIAIAGNKVTIRGRRRADMPGRQRTQIIEVRRPDGWPDSSK